MNFPRYPAYKDSGVPWLGEVPEHWVVQRLRHACMFNPSKSEVKHLPLDSLVSFVAMENIGDKGQILDVTKRELGTVLQGYTYFAEGDVTVAKITPCFENGKGALMRGLPGGFGFGTTELIVVRPATKSLSPDFLSYVVRSSHFRRLGEGSMYGAGGQKRVPDDFVRDFSPAFPPLAEQTRIAAFLDFETARIDALIAEQERLMELLREKRQAVISHTVTRGLDPNVPMKDSGVPWLGEIPAHWEVKRLRYVLESAKAGPFGSSLTKDSYSSSGIRVYGQEQVIADSFAIGDYYIPLERFGDFQQYEVQPGDVLVSCVGTFGRVSIVPNDAERGIINPRLIRMRLRSQMIPEYLAMFLRDDAVKSQFEAVSRGGTMDTINLRTLHDIWLAVPPLAEQSAICAACERESASTNERYVAAEELTALLQERRAALIAAAVTGQIDVRGWRPPEGA